MMMGLLVGAAETSRAAWGGTGVGVLAIASLLVACGGAPARPCAPCAPCASPEVTGRPPVAGPPSAASSVDTSPSSVDPSPSSPSASPPPSASPGCPATVEALAVTLVAFQGTATSRVELRRAGGEVTTGATLVVENDGLLDDSVAASRRSYDLTKDGDCWVVARKSTTRQCARGPARGTWVTTPCP